MLKSLLRVRFAALLAAFTGQSRKRGRQTKGKAVGYALLMLYCFDVRHHGLCAHVHRQCLYGKIPAV